MNYIEKLRNEQFKNISNLSWFETFVYWVFDSTTGKSKVLSKYVSEGLKNVKKTDVLYKIAIGLQKRTPYETVYAIEKYVYNRWDYMSDKKQFGKIDYWESIDEMLGNPFADCESMNRMIYVLCRLAGIGSSFLYCCLGDTNIDTDEVLDHYYTLFFDARRNRLVTLDTAFHPAIRPISRKKKFVCGKGLNYSTPEYIFNENGIWKFKK